MTPFFDPGKNPYGNPKILLAAVGELMTEVAGEVGDGLLVHGFSHRALPARGEPARARARCGQGRQDAGGPDRVVSRLRGHRSRPRRTWRRPTKAVRQQIAFYGSTPAYRPVLELHGWGDLQTELNTLSKRGEWVKMGELIDDEVLDAFAVVCPIDQVATQVKARFGDVVDRFSFYAPYKIEPRRLAVSVGGVPFGLRRERRGCWAGSDVRRVGRRLHDDVDQPGRSNDHPLAALGRPVPRPPWARPARPPRPRPR